MCIISCVMFQSFLGFYIQCVDIYSINNINCYYILKKYQDEKLITCTFLLALILRINKKKIINTEYTEN